MQQTMSFSEMPPNRWVDRSEISHSLWNISCETFGIKNLQGQVRAQSYEIIRGRYCLWPIFKEIVFSATLLAAIDRNGVITHDLG